MLTRERPPARGSSQLHGPGSSGRNYKIAAVSAAAVAALAFQVKAGTGVVRADRAIRGWIDHHQIDWIYTIANSIITTATPLADAITALLVVAIATRLRRRPRLLTTTIEALLGMGAVVLAIKYAVDRPGPDDYGSTHGYFPSGHTASAAVAGLLIRRVLVNDRVITGWLVGVVVLVVAAALLYTDSHWFSDLLGGALIAAFIVAIIPEPAPGTEHAPASASD